MDVLDHLNDRIGCGLCGRRIRYSDDFCTSCRRVAAGVPTVLEDQAVVVEAELEDQAVVVEAELEDQAVVVEAELATLLAVAS